MTDVLKPTFKLLVGETDEQGEPKNGAEQFEFRVPTPLELARLGVREASIRRLVDPASGGWAQGLDDETFFLIRGMAVLELYLEKANVRWPYSEVKEGSEAKVAVDITKFPPGKEPVIMEVGQRFKEALDRFHREGSGHSRPAVPAPVDGLGNPESL